MYEITLLKIRGEFAVEHFVMEIEGESMYFIYTVNVVTCALQKSM